MIATTDSDLRIESVRDGRRQVVRYEFKQPLHPEPVGTSGGTGMGTIVQWDDHELTTWTPVVVNGTPVTITEKRTLRPGGREMVVETTIRVEQGNAGKGSNYSQAVVDVYVKN